MFIQKLWIEDYLAELYWICLIIHQIFSLARDWSKRITQLNIPQLKLRDIRVMFPSFVNRAVAKNIWRIINIIVSIWGGNRLGYLSFKAHCFPRASLLESCSVLGTDNVRRQISELFFGAKWRLLFIYLSNNILFFAEQQFHSLKDKITAKPKPNELPSLHDLKPSNLAETGLSNSFIYYCYHLLAGYLNSIYKLKIIKISFLRTKQLVTG